MYYNSLIACWLCTVVPVVYISASQSASTSMGGAEQVGIEHAHIPHLGATASMVRTYDQNDFPSDRIIENSIIALDSRGYLFTWKGTLPFPESDTKGAYLELRTRKAAHEDNELVNPLRHHLSSDFTSHSYRIPSRNRIDPDETVLFLKKNVALATKADKKKEHYVWRHFGGHLTGDQVEHISFTSAKPIQSLVGHTGKISCTALDTTGYYFLTGSEDQTVILWQLDTRRADEPRARILENIGICRNLKALKVFKHTYPVISVSFNYDTSAIHTQTRNPKNGLIENHFWDCDTAALIADNPFQRYTNPILFHPRLPLLVAVDKDGITVQLWNTVTKTFMLSFKNPRPVCRLIFNEQGSYLACITYFQRDLTSSHATVWSLEDVLVACGVGVTSAVKKTLQLYTKISYADNEEDLPYELEESLRALTEHQIPILSRYFESLHREASQRNALRAPVPQELDSDIFGSLPFHIQECFVEKDLQRILEILSKKVTCKPRELIRVIRELSAPQISLLSKIIVRGEDGAAIHEIENEAEEKCLQSLPALIKGCLNNLDQQDREAAIDYIAQRGSYKRTEIEVAIKALNGQQYEFMSGIISRIKEAEAQANDNDVDGLELNAAEESIFLSLPKILQNCLLLESAE